MRLQDQFFFRVWPDGPWHVFDGNNARCSSSIRNVLEKGRELRSYEDMGPELEYLCLECLKARYDNTAMYEAAAKAARERITNRCNPLCPDCNNRVDSQDGKGQRLRWWKRGRKWVCNGCGNIYNDELKRTGTLRSYGK